MNLNKAFVLGNITRDPEVRALPSGQQVASFGIATNRFYTDGQGQKKQDVEFHNVVCFGKLADIAQRFLTKGSLAMIEGRIKTRNWQNQQGVKQYRTEIIAEVLQLGPRGTGGTKPSFDQANTPATAEASAGRQYQSPSSQPDIPVIEENYTPPATPADLPTQPGNNAPKENSDEINVSDIPF